MYHNYNDPNRPKPVVDFSNKLTELTLNSKVIIDSLTAIARENVMYAKDFVHVLETRIKTCAPDHSLFSIYLMDALIKNIGAPYKDMFREKLCDIFENAFNRVDSSLKSGLCKLLGTWPSIYGHEHVAEICYKIQKLQFNDKPTVTDVSKRALDLVNQSKTNGNPERTNPVPQQPGYPNNNPQNYYPVGNHPMSTGSSYPNNMGPYPHGPNYSYNYQPPTTAIPQPTSGGLSVSEQILRYLIPNGNQPNYQPPTTTPTQSQNNPDSPPPISEEPKVPVAQNNTTKNNSVGYKFTADALKSSSRKIIEKLYDPSVKPCIQCGFRFKDPEKMKNHMDWHFRKNSSEKKKARKPTSRDWFLPLNEWKEYKGLEEIQSSSPAFFDDTAEKNEAEKVSKVIKDESQTLCDICNEEFVSEYDSDDEQWVYIAAVRSEDNNRIYHVDCLSGADNIMSDVNTASNLGKRPRSAIEESE